MTYFFDKIFRRYPIKTRRILEILPGSVSWFLILFPIWGSIFIPYVVAVFILFFDIYWFYRSFSLVVTSYIASKKIKKANSDFCRKNKNRYGLKKIIQKINKAELISRIFSVI